MIYPHDLIVYLSVFEGLNKNKTYQKLSDFIGITPSQVHASVMNGLENRVLKTSGNKGTLSEIGCQTLVLAEFLTYVVPLVFPLRLGPVRLGIPTGSDAAPLSEHFTKREIPWIWPDPQGKARGSEIIPIHKAIPSLALKDKALGDWFHVIEMIRGGNPREKSFSIEWIRGRMKREEK
jgi:hypothetical protein